MTDSKFATTPKKVVVVGSGFGGAVVACRLAQHGYSVTILEMGDELPNGRGNCDYKCDKDKGVTSYGHYQIDELQNEKGQNMKIARGTGVGGGSLHYYGVRLRTPQDIFEDPRWPEEITREVLDPYYNLAGDMLQAKGLECEHEHEGITNPPKRSQAFIDAADASGLLNKNPDFNPNPKYVPIAVNTSSEPFETPLKESLQPCIYCGECVIGCPTEGETNGKGNARALLTLNYLKLAQQHDAKILKLHMVERIERDGAGLKVIVTDKSNRVHEETEMSADKVVLAAGTLGSTEILLKSKGSLSELNDMLGENFSGNGDCLLMTTGTDNNLEPDKAPMITVGGDFSTNNNRIHIEDLGPYPCPQEPDEVVFGLKKTGVDGETPNAISYLGMGTDAGNGVLSYSDGRLCLNWDPKDSEDLYNDIYNAVDAMSKTMDGVTRPSTKEDLGLLTAHPLGGCVMDGKDTEGVVDHKGRVHGVDNLFVVDGAIVPSALSVNPSFTITALAERVAFWMIYDREMQKYDPDTPSNEC